MLRSKNRVVFALLAIFALTAMVAGPAQAKKKPKKPNTVKVMTRNLYLGADLSPAVNSSGAADFVNKNGQILRDVDANNFPKRAKGLAKEINSVSPDLVGLQEVALWRTADPSLTPALTNSPSATTVHVDFLKELMGQLNKGKKRYRVVKVQNEFDFEAPADYDNNPATGVATFGGEINGRLTMRDAILAKVGAGIRTKNLKAAHYKTIYKPVISGITVPVERGWLSSDVKVRKGKWFRFVNTHLESFGDPVVREDQAKELLAKGGPLRSGSMPAVLVGDLNSDDKTVSSDDALAYNALKSGGMSELGVSTKTKTWGVNASVITAGAPTDWSQRIDHVMTNRPKSVKKLATGVTGTKPVNGLWDSDHKGVWSKLKMP